MFDFLKIKMIGILGISLFLASPVFAKPMKQDLSLTVGVYHDVDVSHPPIPKGFSVGGTYKKITKLRYYPKKKKLRFIPKKRGVGTVSIEDKSGSLIYEFKIDIRHTSLHQIKREIAQLLQDVDGINIKILNQKVIIDGKVMLPKEIGRIHSVTKQYKGYAVSFVTLSPMAQNKIAQFMEQRIGNPEIHVRAINGKFFLEGVANSEDEKAKAQIIAEAYAPDIVQDEATADKKIISRKAEFVINLITVRQKKNTPPKAKIIQAVVHYVELHKDYSKGFRFQWTPGIGDGSKIDFQSGRGPSGVVSTISGTISNLLPKLNWAKEHGHARILQSSSIIVESGKKGIVKSVSEIPYQTTTPTGQPTTSFKQGRYYGRYHTSGK